MYPGRDCRLAVIEQRPVPLIAVPGREPTAWLLPTNHWWVSATLLRVTPPGLEDSALGTLNSAWSWCSSAPAVPIRPAYVRIGRSGAVKMLAPSLHPYVITCEGERGQQHDCSVPMTVAALVARPTAQEAILGEKVKARAKPPCTHIPPTWIKARSYVFRSASGAVRVFSR